MKLTKNQIIYIETATLATLRHEGLKPSEKGQMITHEFLLGKKTSSKAISEIIKLYSNGGKSND